MIKIEFEKPFDYEGEKLAGIDLNTEDIKGRDIKYLVKQYKRDTKSKERDIIKELDDEFLLLVAAKMSGRQVEFFDELPAGEYMKVVTEVKNFLLP